MTSRESPDVSLYEQCLAALAHLLQRVSAEHWEQHIRSDLDAWRAHRDAHQHRRKYGGHSSYSDWAISSVNGHQVDDRQAVWANALLRELQLALRALSERPDDVRAETRVLNSLTRHRPVLWPSDTRDDANPRGGAAPEGSLRVIRCQRCNRQQVSLISLERVIANDLLPGFLYEACKSDAIETLIDRLLDNEQAALEDARERVQRAAEKAGLVVVSVDNQGPDQCSACDSDDVSVWSWSLKEGQELRFELADFERERLETRAGPRLVEASAANRMLGLVIVVAAFVLLVLEFRYLVRHGLPDATNSIKTNWGLLMLIGLPSVVMVGGLLMLMSGIGIRDYASVFAQQSLVKRIGLSLVAVTAAVLLILLASTVG